MPPQSPAYLTQKPGICLTVSAPGFLNGLTALANATTNCFPMILISGSSEREIVDLQQGDYEEMDQLAIARPLLQGRLPRPARRKTSASASRAPSAPRFPAVPAASTSTCRPSCSRRRWTPRPARSRSSRSSTRLRARFPAPDAVERALDVLKGAKRPLILLGKGAAYAQADADIRALIEKTGIPYLPMSMAKGLLPDTHAQSAAAARSYVLEEADVVMLIGARLNWLLSHGKGKTWGGEDSEAVHPDRHRADGNRQQRARSPRRSSATSAPAWRRC